MHARRVKFVKSDSGVKSSGVKSEAKQLKSQRFSKFFKPDNGVRSGRWIPTSPKYKLVKLVKLDSGVRSGSWTTQLSINKVVKFVKLDRNE